MGEEKEGGETMFQYTLDIQAETLNHREQWLVKRLQDYKDIDLEIEGCKVALLSSPVPPSITIRPPDEDDPYILARYQEPLNKEWQQEIAITIEKHVTPKWKYITVDRVHNALKQKVNIDEDDNCDILDAIEATKKIRDERVELTPTERAVIQHENMLVQVRERLMMLEYQKRILETALEQMRKHYQPWYELLWRRYVQDEKYVVFLMSTGMSEKFYRNERHRALKKFDKLAVGLQ